MSVEKKTAFLVVHGNLPKKPFQVLDVFTRHLSKTLKKNDLNVRWNHKLKRRDGWIESYISRDPGKGKASVDFYEYYWDAYIHGKIEFVEVLDWLISASKGAKNFYARTDMTDAARKYEKNNVDLFKDGEFKSGGYLIMLGWLSTLLRPLAICGIRFVNSLAISVLKFIFSWLENEIAYLFNDVVMYTTTDVRSIRYEIRQRILGECVKEVKSLIEDPEYERVILVGHSLGSLILYDTLNRIIADMNTKDGISLADARKIVGLVTFGSPLDKIAFFFREHTRGEECVRRQILDNFHCFKHLSSGPNASPVNIISPITETLDDTIWLNFYHRVDKFSGHLDAYEDVDNRECRCSVEGIIDAHSHYWECGEMYNIIAKEFL